MAPVLALSASEMSKSLFGFFPEYWPENTYVPSGLTVRFVAPAPFLKPQFTTIGPVDAGACCRRLPSVSPSRAGTCAAAPWLIEAETAQTETSAKARKCSMDDLPFPAQCAQLSAQKAMTVRQSYVES